jgi:hypothetical protein
MVLTDFLSANFDDILNTACKSLSRAHLKHYDCSEESENHKRLQKLLELTIDCINTKKLLPIVVYMDEAAKERYHAGFDFSEVHAAINVLEETLWTRVNAELKKDTLVEALGLISTVLGAAKESLASTYISLSSKTKVKSLDLNALFGR